ncbi:MAG: Crp/Fnr family transcriptional regulator [Bacteroidetes bacterium]|nr:Crp/Fnr family transcriptional regulator [Bacteroidota bacterium]
MNKEVIRFLSQLTPLSEELENRLNLILKGQTLKKKEFLLRSGEVCSNIYYLEKGLVRVFYTDEEGEQWCSGLLSEGAVCIAVPSFFHRKRSEESIQAIEDTTVYYHSYEELEALYKEFPEYNIIARKLITEYYVLSEERNFWLRKHSAEKKYQFFKERFGDTAGRFPIKDIASYLGIKIETLSRLRGKF